ncbi:MAG: class I SAM-dependent methyltransferase [Betaproteobacteria bacterium]|nr:class I SAM-dependent methyltransferase [Betaproteobacteria bacterium]
MQPYLKRMLLDLSTEPYRATGYVNYRWARGKLGGDPIFPALIQHACLPSGARLLDLGCGRGLLASWLLGAERLMEDGVWTGSVAPPKGLSFRGIELMGREADCGNRALQPLYGKRVQLSGGDMRDGSFEDVDVITILDVLHYIPYGEQNRLLDRIRASLSTDGLFLTRIGDASAGARFAFSQAVDRTMSFIQGHRLPRMWCRPLAAWTAGLKQRGFVVDALPMSMGTPFANVMLVARAT